MDMFELRAWSREERGTRPCRRLRRRGLVPAVLYGRSKPNVLLAVRESDIEQILREHAYIIRLEWNGQAENAQMNEIQMDPLGDEVLHADFMRISLTETVTVSVLVKVTGEAPGVAEGGVLDILMHEIEVNCLPTAIPDYLTADVSGLNINGDLRLGDLHLPEGVSPVLEADAVVAVVTPPVEVPEEEQEEELIGEPEVIGREAGGEEEQEEGSTA